MGLPRSSLLILPMLDIMSCQNPPDFFSSFENTYYVLSRPRSFETVNNFVWSTAYKLGRGTFFYNSMIFCCHLVFYLLVTGLGLNIGDLQS